MEEDGNDPNGQRKRKRPHRNRSVSPSDYGTGSSSPTSSPETASKKLHIEGRTPEVQEATPAISPVVLPRQLTFCAPLERPDTVDVTEHINIPDKIIVRRTKHADHVLVMGTTGCMLDPLLCPLKTNAACEAFRAAGPQFLKAHLETKHSLNKVQMNFVCPCPPWFNICNKDKKSGQMKSCATVLYDTNDDVMPHHVDEKHEEYYEQMETALCELGDEDPDPENSKEKFINLRRLKFPSWTKDINRPFPSQIIPEKVVVRTFVKTFGKKKKLHYLCDLDFCKDEIFEDGMDVDAHILTYHYRRIGMQTELYHACPKYPKECSVTLKGLAEQMEAHVSAVHPEMLGKIYSEDAKKKRAELESQIEGAIVGEAITNPVQTDEDTAETAPQYLEMYTCPVKDCGKYYRRRDYAVWHITTHHEESWNNA